MPVIFTKPERFSRYKNDRLSGLTMSFALVSEAVVFAFAFAFAFAFVAAGADPLTGLYAALLWGLMTLLSVAVLA